MVFGHCGPLIWKNLDVTFAGIDHRFDGKAHAFLQHAAFPRTAVVKDLRSVMKNLANAEKICLKNNARLAVAEAEEDFRAFEHYGILFDRQKSFCNCYLSK